MITKGIINARAELCVWRGDSYVLQYCPFGRGFACGLGCPFLVGDIDFGLKKVTLACSPQDVDILITEDKRKKGGEIKK